MKAGGITLATNKPDNQKTFMELLLEHGKAGVFIPEPTSTQPPVDDELPDDELPGDDGDLEDTEVPNDPFLASLTNKQRWGRSLLKTGGLDAIEDYLDARQAWIRTHPQAW